jgi:hypothetical protein
MTAIDKIAWMIRSAAPGRQWLVQPPSTGRTVPVM